MRRTSWLLIGLLAVVVTALAVTSPARSAPNDVLPQIVTISPASGAELALNSTITFTFNAPMDHASVESALVVKSADGKQTVAGKFNWKTDSVLDFTPSALTRGTDYIFTFNAGAKSAAGLLLKGTDEYRVRTVGDLKITQILPSDGTKDIAANALITVIFNHPVVPLLPVEQQGTLPNPLSLSPAVQGSGTWVTTSIYQFKPAQPLRGGQTYTATVKKGLTDQSGATLTNDVSATFITLAPRVTNLVPADKDANVARDPNLLVDFSQPMDHATTEAAFSLTGPGGKKISGKFSWSTDSQELTFKPDALLDYDGLYDAVIDNTARSSTQANIQSSAQASFTVIAPPTITATDPINGSTTPFTDLKITFSAPMKLDDFAAHVSVDPKPPKIDVTTDDYNKSQVTLSLAVEDKTTYTITIDPNGLTDIYGTALVVNRNSPVYTVLADGRIQIKLTIKLSFPPEAALQTAGNIGLYSAYAPVTRVYSTHRNVNELDLNLWKISVDDLTHKLLVPVSNGDATSNFDAYVPPDAGFLRAWKTKVTNPPQTLRYDLLPISASGASANKIAGFTCPGALPTRLYLGEAGVVLSDDPQPLNVHQDPSLKSNVTDRIVVGTPLMIHVGPICADGYVWWEVSTVPQTINKTQTPTIYGWVAEGDAKHYFIGDAAAPTDQTPTPQPPRPTALAGTGSDPLKPGIYWLTLSTPDVNSGLPLKHVMIVATANITLKMADTGASAWVSDLQSGLPVPNVSVKFLMGQDQTLISTVNTDANGIASVTYPHLGNLYNASVIAVVDDGKNLAIGSSGLTDGLDPYNFNLSADYYANDSTVYLYSDRSLYKPGQPVYFRGVLRSRKDVSYTLSDRKTVPIEILDDKGESIYKTDAPVTDFGTFSGQFTLDSRATLGYYRIVASLDDPTKKLPESQQANEFSRTFSVADYRPPEFQVNATADHDQVVQGDKVRVTMNSRFFFGGAVNNVPVTWSLLSDNYFFNYTGSGSYSFYDYNEDSGPTDNASQYGDQIGQGSGKTDANGDFVIEVPADLGKAKQSQTFTIEAQVTDESGQVVAGRAQVIVHAGTLYVGAAPEEYVTAANAPTKIDVIAVDWNSKPVPNTDVQVRAVEREWHSVQQVSPENGSTTWSYDVKENPIDSATVHTDADGKAIYSFTPPRGGDYKIYVTTKDARGNTVTASTFVYVAGTDYVPWRQRNSNTIDLKTDKTAYQVGDTASILIASPFQGTATAWVTVERGGILKSEVVTLTSNSYVYKLPIDASFAPNAFVSVMLVKGVDDKNPTPAFRMGLAEITVNAEQLKLNIDIKSDKPQAGPREIVNYAIHVSDYQGKPVKAEVGVGLTDLAVLSLLPDTSTPIMQHFYDTQSLGVVTSSTLTISVDAQTQQILNTVKGGGGGGPEGGIFEVRQLFLDTPLWKPAVKTDDNGNATVSVTLPDQLTTWRLDARAVTLPTGSTNSTLVGQQTFDLISTKPLLIRPVTARFFVTGDTSVMAAVVNNNTGADQQVTVRIDVKGMTLSTPSSTTISIPAGQRARVEWPVTILDAPAVDVTFYASSADNKFTDAAKSAVGQGDAKTLPVYKYQAPETVATSGLISKDGGTVTEGIILPGQASTTQGALDLRFDPSLAAVTGDALTALNNTPYDCTEQTVSRFLPNVVTYKALGQLKIDNSALKSTLDNAINIALQRLYNQQHVDGGWGWCVEDASTGTVSAWALIGLVEAKNDGYTVDSAVTNKAITFVQGQLQELGNQAGVSGLNRQAFMLYALARAGAGNVSRSVRLFTIREQMSIYARAYLAMTFHILNAQDNAHIAPLIADLQTSAVTSASGQHWQESYQDTINWNTDTRTTAIALQALVETQPTNALIPNVVRWLIIARKSDGWETTQETAWAVMALSDWMVASNELNPSYTFSATLNDKSLVNTTPITTANIRTPVTQQIQVASLLTDTVNKLAITRAAGSGVLYYTANLTTYLPVDQVKALNRGIGITRTYSLASDKANAPIMQAHVGDDIRVHLTLVVPSDLNYVVLTDPIPAGTEAINPNLATSGSVGTQPELRLQDPLSGGYGWWWFGDTQLKDEKTVLSAQYLPAGTYQYTYVVRAGLAGAYHVIPAIAQELYLPEVYGRSDGQLFTLLPATNAASDPTQAQATAAP